MELTYKGSVKGGQTMKDILDEAQEVVNQYAQSRPEDIGATDSDCMSASEQVRYLLRLVKGLSKLLGEACWQAVKRGDWRRALLIRQGMVRAPFLHCISRG